MGKPFRRLKYGQPESHRGSDRIGHGEAVSMITDLLTSDDKRWDLRRRVDNQVRYAGRTGKLSIVSSGTYQFGEIAAWANKMYGKENPKITRMHHGANVAVLGVTAVAQVRLPRVFCSSNDYRIVNEKLEADLAKLRTKCESLESDAAIGIKVREGGRKGGNAPKYLR